MKKRSFKPEDLYTFNALGAAQTSPDGKLIAYVLLEVRIKFDGEFSVYFL